MLGEQSGERPTGGGVVRKAGNAERPSGWKETNRTEATWEASTGTAARFFYNADYTLDKLEAADPLFYCAKAARRERDAGLEAMPLKHTMFGDGGETYDGISNSKNPTRNPHPTLKPLKLTQHLATLLLPPSEYAPRRLFVPFSGAGSEMIGAMLAGWEVVQGVEMEAEYAEIARARLAHWSKRQLGLVNA
jgi:hypothetical protein